MTADQQARELLILLRDAHRRLDEMGVPPAPYRRPVVEREEIAA